MKKQYPFLIITCLVASCDKKCETTDICALPQTLERYFERYKTGSWWTYSNQDNTKTDSIYISQHTDGFYQFVNGSNDCIRREQKSFRLHANHYSSLNESETKNMEASYTVSDQCSRSHLYVKLPTSNGIDIEYNTDFEEYRLDPSLEITAMILDSLIQQGNVTYEVLVSNQIHSLSPPISLLI
jgi:hypothetical protein